MNQKFSIALFAAGLPIFMGVATEMLAGHNDWSYFYSTPLGFLHALSLGGAFAALIVGALGIQIPRSDAHDAHADRKTDLVVSVDPSETKGDSSQLDTIGQAAGHWMGQGGVASIGLVLLLGVLALCALKERGRVRDVLTAGQTVESNRGSQQSFFIKFVPVWQLHPEMQVHATLPLSQLFLAKRGRHRDWQVIRTVSANYDLRPPDAFVTIEHLRRERFATHSETNISSKSDGRRWATVPQLPDEYRNVSDDRRRREPDFAWNQERALRQDGRLGGLPGIQSLEAKQKQFKDADDAADPHQRIGVTSHSVSRDSNVPLYVYGVLIVFPGLCASIGGWIWGRYDRRWLGASLIALGLFIWIRFFGVLLRGV